METTIDLAIERELFLRVREKTKADRDSGSTRVDNLRMPVYLVIFALAQ
jgi:hypothetical protein